MLACTRSASISATRWSRLSSVHDQPDLDIWPSQRGFRPGSRAMAGIVRLCARASGARQPSPSHHRGSGSADHRLRRPRTSIGLPRGGGLHHACPSAGTITIQATTKRSATMPKRSERAPHGSIRRLCGAVRRRSAPNGRRLSSVVVVVAVGMWQRACVGNRLRGSRRRVLIAGARSTAFSPAVFPGVKSLH